MNNLTYNRLVLNKTNFNKIDIKWIVLHGVGIDIVESNNNIARFVRDSDSGLLE